MKVPRSSKPARGRRYIFSAFFTAALTTTMVATGGFGVFPDNPVTETFQEVISENFPPEVLEPFNGFMVKLSAPQIPPASDSGSDENSPPDPVGGILTLFATNNIPAVDASKTPLSIESTLTALSGTQTEVASVQSIRLTMTQFQIETLTANPTITVTLPPTLTQTAMPTSTPQLVYYYYPPTATEEPEQPAPPVSLTTTVMPAPTHLVLYFGSTSMGNIGPRSTADALCIANLPYGYSNYHAFLGYSAADSISNMPANYGVPTGLPIQSDTNVVLANNWADLMDGSIAAALDTAGVSPADNWWSGVENADGTHIDGVTFDCNDWTSNSNVVGGNEGFRSTVNSTWMDGFVAACDQPIAVLCLAY